MKYSTGAIVLHWLIALLIGLNYIGAYEAEDLAAADKAYAMAGHKAFGMTILVLTVLRIVWRLTHTSPPLSLTLKTWEAGLAKAVHSLFYLFTLGVPLMGWAMHSAATGGAPVNAFGLFAYPGLPLAQSKAMAGLFHELHETLATLMLVLIGLHVMGALKHVVIDRDGGFRRMWFGRVR